MTAAEWDAQYANVGQHAAVACRVLQDFGHLLPTKGRALDLACGLGGNAFFLASRGLETVAWDHSPVAIQSLQSRVAKEALNVFVEVRDVALHPPAPESFDVIVVSRFLIRELTPVLSAALRPGGLLFYQTFGPPLVDRGRGPRQSDFRLCEWELPNLFPALQLRVYREEGGLGDTSLGLRDEVYGVFERPL